MSKAFKCAVFAAVTVVGFGGTACSVNALSRDDSGNGITADDFLASLTQAQHDSLCAEIDAWGARPSDPMFGGMWRDFIAQADIAGDPDAIYDILEASCTPSGLPLGERPWRFEVGDVVEYFAGGTINFRSAEPGSDDTLGFTVWDTAGLQRVIDHIGVGNCVVGMRADSEDLLAHLDDVLRVECPTGSNNQGPAEMSAATSIVADSTAASEPVNDGAWSDTEDDVFD